MIYIICPVYRSDAGYIPMPARKYEATDEASALVLYWQEIKNDPITARIGADVYDTHADETAREWVGYIDDLAAFAATA